jgi:tryptophan synthase alpha chain
MHTLRPQRTASSLMSTQLIRKSYTMSRIRQTFEDLNKTGKKALIPFITAGYPDIATTEKCIFQLERSGADLIELGVPFSDPMADGPVIQAASEHALRKGTTLKMILELVKRVRRKTELPILLMGYYNPFFTFGLVRFADEAKKAGVDGVLVVDLPPEEAGPLKAETERTGLDLIFLLAPTSDDGRIQLVAKNASGFIYYVSLTGVTGVRSQLDKDIRKQVMHIKQKSNLPVAIGFGISTPEQAKRVAHWADAVVVGSAIIKIIENSTSPEAIIKNVGQFVLSLKKAIIQ